MTVSSFVKFDGIPGSVKGGKNDGQTEVYELRYHIEMPVDVRDGSITGRRQHGGFSLTIEMGKECPLLAKHLCENIELATVTIEHYKPDPASGDIKHYFTHELKKALVTNLSVYKLNTCSDEAKRYRDMCQISLNFGEITIKDTEGNEYTDEWMLK
ncbi:MAG: type VI secretion system tube protein Hcp [Acidobacteria bacterium]|nr:type VI secretion system tube protein Hcp [Acidobacteriota bacterium]MCB9398100.1 type VI secretion system tube protein Hcp [Acidobacteriota bacterium]